MFKLHSEFKPTGDQPQAIDYLVKGINEGKKFQTLLGVTGSRKNFHNGKHNRKSTEANIGASTQQNIGADNYTQNSKSFFQKTELNTLLATMTITNQKVT